MPAADDRPRERVFGTDGVRGLANGLLVAELALDLSVAAAHVLGEAGAFSGHRPRARGDLAGRAEAVGSAPLSFPAGAKRRGRESTPAPPDEWVPEARARHRIEALPIGEAEALHVGRLPALHRDPFDRQSTLEWQL